jgi:hypothetical protein
MGICAGSLRRVPATLRLTRAQILAHRRIAQSLDERLPAGAESLRWAAAPGLQDSVPRSALHALHARVEGIGFDAWQDPALSQVWGPRYTAYVVPAGKHEPFTLGRLPIGGRLRGRAEELAARLRELLGERRMLVDDAGSELGVHPNSLRYAALTGTVLIRWEGARQPTIWMVPASGQSAVDALQELARRYMHHLGPSTVSSFVRWGGLDMPAAVAAFETMAPSLLAVRTPLGEAWILADDEASFRRPAASAADARLLPSGDPYYLLWGADRDLLVPDPARRDMLWTSRVWPGAVLVDGEVAGTWRRAGAVVVVTPWRHLEEPERAAVEREASTLPLSADGGGATVTWEEADR